MIRESQLKVVSVDDFAKAAESAVKMALMVQVANSMNLDLIFMSKQSSTKKEEKNKKSK